MQRRKTAVNCRLLFVVVSRRQNVRELKRHRDPVNFFFYNIRNLLGHFGGRSRRIGQAKCKGTSQCLTQTALQPHLRTIAYRVLSEVERVVADADRSALVLWSCGFLVTSTLTSLCSECEEEDVLSKGLTPRVGLSVRMLEDPVLVPMALCTGVALSSSSRR
jgi:hypothetical protein